MSYEAPIDLAKKAQTGNREVKIDSLERIFSSWRKSWLRNSKFRNIMEEVLDPMDDYPSAKVQKMLARCWPDGFALMIGLVDYNIEDGWRDLLDNNSRRISVDALRVYNRTVKGTQYSQRFKLYIDLLDKLDKAGKPVLNRTKVKERSPFSITLRSPKTSKRKHIDALNTAFESSNDRERHRELMWLFDNWKDSWVSTTKKHDPDAFIYKLTSILVQTTDLLPPYIQTKLASVWPRGYANHLYMGSSEREISNRLQRTREEPSENALEIYRRSVRTAKGRREFNAWLEVYESERGTGFNPLAALRKLRRTGSSRGQFKQLTTLLDNWEPEWLGQNNDSTFRFAFDELLRLMPLPNEKLQVRLAEIYPRGFHYLARLNLDADDFVNFVEDSRNKLSVLALMRYEKSLSGRELVNYRNHMEMLQTTEEDIGRELQASQS